MTKIHGLTAFLLSALFIFLAFIPTAPAQDTSASNATANSAANANDSSSISLQGIWKANLGDSEIIMAISQSGEALYGLAKYEGENPWNGAVSGLVSVSSSSLSSQSTAFLSLAALESDIVASATIRADAVDGTMSGIFIRSDSSGKASRGDFTATMISPDTSTYTPVEIATSSQESSSSAAQDQVAQTESENETATVADSTAEQSGNADNVAAASANTSASSATTESRFKDVTVFAKSINPNIMPTSANL